jgi:mannose-6-phosphate isomerase
MQIIDTVEAAELIYCEQFMEQIKERILTLHGKIQHYAWGDCYFIPEFLGIEKQDNKPCAEYWMGAHPSASSIVDIQGKQEALDILIKQNPEVFIGEDVFKKFGELPYLFKVLDVKNMLSIQVHPSKEEAAKGFATEEAAGIPINAAHRNYKDKNHKPEVMVALSDFWLLHGFKQQDQLTSVLNNEPEFKFLIPVFEQSGYKGLYKEVMELPQHKVDELLLPLVKRELGKKNQLTKDQPGFWICKLYEEGENLTNIDRGIFSIYFFNIVQVQPGQAVFQGAGIPHAYLEGQNVELMANSDNVLRGGLTPKHIDVAELMKHTTFEGVTPNVMKGEALNDVEKVYPCPVEDFGISAIELRKGQNYKHKSTSAEIYLVIDGSIAVNDKQYSKGKSFYVLPSTSLTITANNQAIIYKAFVP